MEPSKEKSPVVGGEDTSCPLPQRDAALNRPAPKPSTSYVSTGGVPIRPPNPSPALNKEVVGQNPALDQLLFPRSERRPGNRGDPAKGKRIPITSAPNAGGVWLAVATPQVRRPSGPPRNDRVEALSLRGAKRRGNPQLPSCPRPPQGDDRPMSVPELPGHLQPRLLLGRMSGMTAGTPLRVFVLRPTVPRKRAAKRPRPFPGNPP